MSLLNLMIHQCDVQAQVQSKTGGGLAAVGWSTVATAVPCRFDKLKPDVAAVVYGKFDATQLYRVYFTTDLSLTVDSRLVYNGSNYRVIGVNNVSGLARLWQIDVEQRPDNET